MSKEKWDSKDIADQKGRVAIVTGSSSGVGYETARVLAEKNASVIIAVRNLKKRNAAADKILEQHPDTDVKGSDYFGPSGRKEWKGYPAKVKSNELSHNEEIAQKLWEVSEELAGVKFNLD